MISIIICTQHERVSENLLLNIAKTIGVEFELITINNEKNKYSIFEAYNIGVAKAEFSICCFMHDDIIYRSEDWGLRVLEYFKTNDELGAVAVAGCKYLRKMPSFWSIPIFNVFNIIQSDRKTHSSTKYWLNNSDAERVIVFDGMWFCVKRELFDKIQFDSTTYNGFHFYDLDIAMQIHTMDYHILSVPNILIEHTSSGSLNKYWLVSAFKFHNKWKSFLPVALADSTPEYSEELEDAAIVVILRTIFYEKAYLLLIDWLCVSIRIRGFIRFVFVLLKFFSKKI